VIDFKAALNDEQRAAATAGDGPLLVLAAAGTGKTRTLVYRVAYLVERGIDPRRILLLTFTNKAAREMLDRAGELVGARVGGMWGGTFHHMANRILRQNAAAIGYSPNFNILDRDDSLTLIRHCIKEFKPTSVRDFPKPEVLSSLFSLAANTEGSLVEIAHKHFEGEVDPADVARVGQMYEARKKRQGVMDFDDLLVWGLKLFRDHPTILARYQQQFLYTLVDEYQDTNSIQSEWVDRIAAGNGNLLVVGDDFQSIYSWRGADFRNILSFPQRYPACQTFKLETNYRSVPEVLNVANACIAGNPEQFQKTLRSTRAAYHRPTLARLENGEAQAQFAMDQIRHYHREGYAYADIAVLYRAHFHAMELQLALTRAHVPYVITSGVRFFEQAHVKDVCAILRPIQHPGDEMAFRRLLQLLPKVGERTADRIWTQLGYRFRPQTPEDGAAVEKALPAPARPFWQGLREIWSRFRQDEQGQNAGELMREWIKAYYNHYALNTFDNYERRMEDLEELMVFAGRHETLDQLLSEIALMTNMDGEAAAGAPAAPAGVRLSTIHQAKGLEWPVVLILWAAEGMFPSARAMKDNEDGEAEERRLFYVAVTRAKDELVLCAPEVRRMADGGYMPLTPSRFVREIPRTLLLETRPQVEMPMERIRARWK
jgi:DNA helicase II / ATP-dependent DNA helicase PcrA